MARESKAYDVVIVGAGPAGLAAAIRLKQVDAGISVVVLEKGAEPGAHIVSGASMDPVALDELIPDWRQRGAPLNQPAAVDELLLLGERGALRIPRFLIPDGLRNEGCYLISLGRVVRWMAGQAEALGVEIRCGCAAAEVLYDAAGAVRGVATGAVGVGRDGRPTARWRPGIEVLGRYTLFAEGARGHLGRRLVERFRLDAGCDPQTYAIGLKELWEVPPALSRPGLLLHVAGWPLDAQTYGGGSVYHLEDGQVVLALIIGLDYQNPWLDPYREMQRWKTHPAIRRHVEGGRRLGFGARAITCGGLLSLPRLTFPGGALLGCDAGTLNPARIKGSHAAIKTGLLAADAVAQALAAGRSHDEPGAYAEAFGHSWLHRELEDARNARPWFRQGLAVGTLMTGVEQWLLPRLGVRNPPWTRHRRLPDHARLHAASQIDPVRYPPPDGRLSFDLASSLALARVRHEEDQPVHLKLRDPDVPVAFNLATYAGPESRYCPAAVFAYVKDDDGGARLRIDAHRCLHCKACDIKDPAQNIVWVPPEGGDGPNYVGL